MHATPEMRAALGVVRETDQELYARMRVPAWRLSTSMDVFTTSPGFFLALEMEDSALGVTQRTSWRTGLPLRAPRVWVNGPLSALVSTDRDTPLRYVQAMIIAHEFRHVTQPSMIVDGAMETDAFNAGDAFAARLPEPYASRMLALSAHGRELETGAGYAHAMLYTPGGRPAMVDASGHVPQARPDIAEARELAWSALNIYGAARARPTPAARDDALLAMADALTEMLRATA